MDDIVLPPMPDAVDLPEVIRNYARAAVIADRERRTAQPEPDIGDYDIDKIADSMPGGRDDASDAETMVDARMWAVAKGMVLGLLRAQIPQERMQHVLVWQLAQRLVDRVRVLRPVQEMPAAMVLVRASLGEESI